MFECTQCGCKTLIWNSDFNAEDYGIESDGIVSCFTCSNEDCDVIIHQIELWDEEEGTEYKDVVIEKNCDDDCNYDDEIEQFNEEAWDAFYERLHNEYFK